jgi:hypothetical protein
VKNSKTSQALGFGVDGKGAKNSKTSQALGFGVDGKGEGGHEEMHGKKTSIGIRWRIVPRDQSWELPDGHFPLRKEQRGLSGLPWGGV